MQRARELRCTWGYNRGTAKCTHCKVRQKYRIICRLKDSWKEVPVEVQNSYQQICDVFPRNVLEKVDTSIEMEDVIPLVNAFLIDWESSFHSFSHLCEYEKTFGFVNVARLRRHFYLYAL